MSTFSSTTVMKVTFSGRATSGAISVVGVKVGDVIVRITDPGNTSIDSYFEGMVSVDDEIQQNTNNDFSTLTFTGVLVR